MGDIQFTIGGTPAPFLTAMQQVKESAKESAEKVTESFGIEGVKSERALHGRFESAFKDITKNGTNSAEAIGGAFENLTEGLKLSMGSMIALLAVTELVKGMYAGYEAAEKMSGAVKDALSIDSNVSDQSVEKVNEDIKKLKADAEATNLASMSNMTAGATVFIQALEEGKAIADVTREDAESYNRIKKEAHDMEDAQAAKEINNANAVLALKVEGHDKEADALAHEQEMQEKLLAAKDKGNQDTIDALNKQLELESQLAAKQEEAEQAKKDKQVADISKQIAAEVDKRNEAGMSDEDKLAAIKTRETQEDNRLRAAVGTAPVGTPIVIEQPADTTPDPNAGNDKKFSAAYLIMHPELAPRQEQPKKSNQDIPIVPLDPIEAAKLELQYNKYVTAEKELQAKLDKSKADLTKQIAAEQNKGKRPEQANIETLAESKLDRTRDTDAYTKAQQDGKTGEEDLLKLRLQMEKSITAQREAQAKVDQDSAKRVQLIKEQKQAQQDVQAAQLDATMFHGAVSSLAKIGAGGRVSGANYGNQSQLKAAQEAAKHLGEINKKIDALAKGIGVAGS